MSQETRLTIIIKNSNPVELRDVVNMFSGLQSEYKIFLSEYARYHDNQKVNQIKLFLNEVRKGSLEFELVAILPFVLSGMENLNTLFDFAQHLKNLFDRLKQSLPEKTDYKQDGLIPPKSLKNIQKITQPVARDKASQFILAGNNQQVHIHLNSEEASLIKNNGERLLTIPSIARDKDYSLIHSEQFEQVKQIESKRLGDLRRYNKVLFYWSGEQGNITPDRGIIDEVAAHDLHVIFDNDDIEKEMRSNETNPFEKAYIVDVGVQTVKNIPWVYKILKLYETLDRPYILR